MPPLERQQEPQELTASEFVGTQAAVEVWYELDEDDVEPYVWAYGTSFPTRNQLRHARPLPHAIDHMAAAGGFPIRINATVCSSRKIETALPKPLPVDAAGAPCPVGGIESSFLIPTARQTATEALTEEVLDQIDRNNRRFLASSVLKITRLQDICPKIPNLTVACHWGALIHKDMDVENAVWKGNLGLTRSDSGHSIHLARLDHEDLDRSVIWFAQFPNGWAQFWGLSVVKVTQYRLQLSYSHFLDTDLVWQFRF